MPRPLMLLLFVPVFILSCGGDDSADEPNTTPLDSELRDLLIENYGGNTDYGSCLYDMIVEYSGGEEELLDALSQSVSPIDELNAIAEDAFQADPEQATVCSELDILHLTGLDIPAGTYAGRIRAFLEVDGDSTPFCLAMKGLEEDGELASWVDGLDDDTFPLPESTPRPGQIANPDDAQRAGLAWLDECEREVGALD